MGHNAHLSQLLQVNQVIYIIPYQPVKFQDNGLNSFWDILLTKLKCWTFSKGHI